MNNFVLVAAAALVSNTFFSPLLSRSTCRKMIFFPFFPFLATSSHLEHTQQPKEERAQRELAEMMIKVKRNANFKHHEQFFNCGGLSPPPTRAITRCQSERELFSNRGMKTTTNERRWRHFSPGTGSSSASHHPQLCLGRPTHSYYSSSPEKKRE